MSLPKNRINPFPKYLRGRSSKSSHGMKSNIPTRQSFRVARIVAIRAMAIPPRIKACNDPVTIQFAAAQAIPISAVTAMKAMMGRERLSTARLVFMLEYRERRRASELAQHSPCHLGLRSFSTESRLLLRREAHGRGNMLLATPNAGAGPM